MSNSMLTALTEIGIFGALASPDLQQLASLLREKSFIPNQTIFIQGEEGQGLYLIRSGRVKICANDRLGNELIFTYLSSGDLLGEIAILDGLPRSATAIAVTYTIHFIWIEEIFWNFSNLSPSMHRYNC